MPYTSSWRPWVVCLAAGLFFFFAFVQVNMFNTINPFLLEEFKVSAAQLGQLSSYYFIANVFLLFPAGMLLDRISTLKIILCALLLVIIGTSIFALSNYFWLASIGRFLVGIGGTFALLSALKIASRWFPSERMALITGSIVTMAMIGGMVAQTPFVYLTDHLGWRNALFVDAGLGLVCWLIIAILVRDYPPEKKNLIAEQAKKLSHTGFWATLGRVIMNKQTWLGGLYTSLTNLPLFILGAMWGNMFLVQTANLTRAQASLVSTMLFVGMIFGSPFFGWFSDKMRKRKPPMMIGAIIALGAVLIIIFTPNLPFWAFLLTFGILGFTIGSQVIGYPLVAESNTPALTGTALGLASVLIMAGGLTLPIVGWILGLNWNHAIINNIPLYSITDYHNAMLIMPIGLVLAIIIAFLARETNCKIKEN